jgi:predicted phosphodiesterase
MRIGLIADVHGSLAALDTVLAELEADCVDQIVCLGDLAVLGPQPNEVIARIRERKIATVCGNTDCWLVANHPILAEPPDSPPSVDHTSWARNAISESNLAYLGRLPLTIAIPLGPDRELLCFHGSPASVDDMIGDWHGRGGEPGVPLFAGGHTHIQELRRLGDTIYVNPGSVGLPGVGPGGADLPVNRDVSWAEYAVLNDGDGRTEISLRRTPVDIDQMWAEARRSGMPHADWWQSRWARRSGSTAAS